MHFVITKFSHLVGIDFKACKISSSYAVNVTVCKNNIVTCLRRLQK